MRQRKICPNQKIKVALLDKFLNKHYENASYLSENEKHNVMYKVFLKLLKKYPSNEPNYQRVQATIQYFADREEFEKCIDLQQMLTSNKLKFNKTNE